MNVWWWVPIGFGAWFLIALALGLCLGPILRHSTEAWEAVERQMPESDVHHPRPWDGLQASLGQEAGGYMLNRSPQRGHPVSTAHAANLE